MSDGFEACARRLKDFSALLAKLPAVTLAIILLSLWKTSIVTQGTKWYFLVSVE